jgi:hypothetical protein
MSILTYGIAAASKVAKPLRHGLFARIARGLIQYRQRQAINELRRHGLRLPHELERAGLKVGSRNEDSLPFVR